MLPWFMVLGEPASDCACVCVSILCARPPAMLGDVKRALHWLRTSTGSLHPGPDCTSDYDANPNHDPNHDPDHNPDHEPD